MPIKLSMEGTDLKITEKLRYSQSKVTEAVLDKMMSLMTRLQAKARANVFSSELKSTRVMESITDPQARIEGYKIVGTLQWGGVELPPTSQGFQHDLAKIAEYGAHGPYKINPVNRKFLYLQGLDIYRAYVVNHPGVLPQRFMASAVDEMRESMESEIRETIEGVLKESK